jgi:Na+-translocating ferredoxin:NAD+ oxidoreductase subunit B
MPADTEIYRALQRHLDKGPYGFATAPSGADIALLKLLFTPSEARVAASLSLIRLEPAGKILRRLKKAGIDISLDELRRTLDHMAFKGTVLVYRQGFKEDHYKNAEVGAGGIIDFQVDRLTKDLVDAYRRYHEEVLLGPSRPRTPGRRSILPLRTVPVEKSIPLPEKLQVSTYDDIRRILEESPGPFAVANCLCRQLKDMQGSPCRHSDLRETCLQIGTDHARQYVDMGIARYISKEEAFDILEKAQQEGFIVQPENSLHPEAICCCCDDCCLLLSRIARSPRPAALYSTNYFVEVDPALCNGCGVCIERCQLGARVMTDGAAKVNPDRCIGCGNCVVTCEAHATRLVKKGVTPLPPKDKDAINLIMLSARFGRWKMLKLRLKMLLGMDV